MKLIINGLTLQQLQSFDAVVAEGGFQAAGARLRRSHPTVFTAIRNLEAQLGVKLFDRSGYRVSLTPAGRALHARARALLAELTALRDHAAHLAAGEESELSVVIGDLCPLPRTLALLRRFFDACPATRLHLHFEAISGPWERLFDDEANLILHHVDQADPRLEFIDLFRVDLFPVVAPGFLDFEITQAITPRQMRDYPQIVIRDSARHSPPRDYHLVEGARSWTVGDQMTKKELILQGMGWGHLPLDLIEAELNDGRLGSIAGAHFRGGRAQIVAARRRDRPAGPVAARLWRHIQNETQEAPVAEPEPVVSI